MRTRKITNFNIMNSLTTSIDVFQLLRRRLLFSNITRDKIFDKHVVTLLNQVLIRAQNIIIRSVKKKSISMMQNVKNVDEACVICACQMLFTKKFS